MTYRSPNRGYELRSLEGNPGKIEEDAKSFVSLADDLDALEDELEAIADSSVHKSKGTDALAELAGKAKPEVAKAATRYRGTGETLAIYAPALQTAKDWIDDNKESIEAAERDYQDAIDAAATARDEQESLLRVWMWEDDPTAAQKSAAAAAVSNAEAAETSAKNLRDGKWESFESTFSTWSDAYDDAVEGVDGAIEAAGNNDGFWEGLADFLDILGWVVTALAVVALFISGPIGALVMALVILGSLVLLAGKIAQFATGRATLLELGVAIFSVATLGAGGALARAATKAAPSMGAAVQATRAAARPAIRAGLPGATLRPSTWARPITNRFAARSAARAATPVPGHLAPSGMLPTLMNSIRFGGPSTGRTLQFLQTARGNLGQYPAVVSSIDEMIGLATPSIGSQAVQVSLWGSGTLADVADKGGFLPSRSPVPNL